MYFLRHPMHTPGVQPSRRCFCFPGLRSDADDSDFALMSSSKSSLKRSSASPSDLTLNSSLPTLGMPRSKLSVNSERFLGRGPAPKPGLRTLLIPDVEATTYSQPAIAGRLRIPKSGPGAANHTESGPQGVNQGCPRIEIASQPAISHQQHSQLLPRKPALTKLAMRNAVIGGGVVPELLSAPPAFPP